MASYAEITNIAAPTEAAAGSLISVDVSVKNIWTGPFLVAITGAYDGVALYPSIDSLIIDPGQTLHFYFTFLMPNKSVRLDFWSWFWTTDWVQDDAKSHNIALVTLSPVFRGFGVIDYSKI